ncbi:MAG: hypothetical protein J5597_01120 [Spirochaetaceae bacterium]|nr:hypothetical protein [Spirochaetaceae bacterium]
MSANNTLNISNSVYGTFYTSRTAQHDHRTVLLGALLKKRIMARVTGIEKVLQIWNFFTIRGLEQWKIQR